MGLHKISSEAIVSLTTLTCFDMLLGSILASPTLWAATGVFKFGATCEVLDADGAPIVVVVNSGLINHLAGKFQGA